MGRKIGLRFFERDARIVAKDLLGKIIVRKFRKKFLKGKIVETEAYFGKSDPASWARYAKRKDNFSMWEKGGTILIKNVHKHLMLNFVTGKKGFPEAVLIRAIEPINFEGRCSGPGLLTKDFLINKNMNAKNLFDSDDLFIEDSCEKFKIGKSPRVGVKNDLKILLRFYIKGNKCVSSLK